MTRTPSRNDGPGLKGRAGDAFSADMRTLLAALVLVGCGAGGDVDPEVRSPELSADVPSADDLRAAVAAQDSYPLAWWPHVSPAFVRAAERWTAATGLAIELRPDGAPKLSGGPNLRPPESSAHPARGQCGASVRVRADRGARASARRALAPSDLDTAAQHALPGAMLAWWTARDTGVAITTELLEAVCSARPCTRMVPEGAW